jgi:predicted RND superfamily exporter protein
MAQLKQNRGTFEKIATFIVDKRTMFFLLYIFALIFCLVSSGWVNVENDVTTYLSEDTETRQGLDAMNGNFITPGTARVMVSNITLDTAWKLSDTIAATNGVAMVAFDGSDATYKNTSALFEITFMYGPLEQKAIDSMEAIRSSLAGYDHWVDTTVGYDENAMLDDEMTVIGIVAVIIVLVVLTLTSRSYAEVPVLLITFGMAAVLNIGTNFIFDKISFISDSVAVVLQLALAVDYAIILCHRFTDEHEHAPAREAAIAALSKAIPEISSSSMTTICGLAALGFMKFSIGMDMAMVLIKAIFLSLFTVFTLMPGLLVLFAPLMNKTKHKKLLPNITLLGKLAVKTRRVLPPLFIILLVFAFILSSQCPYCYSYNDLKTAKLSERQQAYFQIKDTFGVSNMLALLVPVGNYEAEMALLADLEAQPEVKSVMGLGNIEAMDGYMLTDSLNPREFSQLVGLDYEIAQALYALYAVDQNQYGQILSMVEDYEVSLFDMFLFLKDQLQSHNIQLAGEEMAMMDDMFGQLEMAKQQMQSQQYSRMVMYLDLPEESPETFAFLAEARDIVGQYYDGDYYLIGNSTSCRDLSASFATDNLMISILSALFVIIVLLFTFQSAGLPVLLILVIQGSIWINFSFPTLTETPLYFLGYLIVSAIQMGANIDYAIVISSHYQELKATMPHKQAIVEALNKAFPTVFTSGIMMASAGLLIGNLSAQPVVSIMGMCIGRGTIVSIILVLLVLPSILVLGDSIIERTRFRLKGKDAGPKQVAGTMLIRGRIRGFVHGYVDANVEGVLHGQLDATVSTGSEVTQQDTPADAAEEGGQNNE